MANKVRLDLRELDEPSYERELLRIGGGTGFHRWFFLDAIAAAGGLELRAFLVTRDGEPVGVTPVLLRRRGPVAAANQLRVPHLGPLSVNGTFTQVIDTISSRLARERVVMTRWGFGPRANADQNALRSRGFWINREPTLVFRMRPPDESWNAMSANLRRSIQRTQKKGVEGGPSTREEILECFPRLVVQPFLRQGITPPFSLRCLASMAERLADHPDIWWWSARKGGEPVTIANVLLHDGRAYGWMMGGLQLPGLSPQATAHWDLMQRCAAQGLDYEVGGAPTDGVGELKVRLGAVYEDAFTALRVRPRIFAVAARLQQRLASS